MNKILIFGFVFLLIVIAGIFLLKPAKKCPTDKPYLENGKCVNACASGKRDDKKCLTLTQNCPTTRPVLSEGVCVASCPASNPANISGVCKPCSENTTANKINDNGTCVAVCSSGKRDGNNCVTSCPSGNPYLEDGVCLSQCQSGKRDGNNCVTSCPETSPYLENGVCVSTCQSGFRIGNNCIDSCPTDNPYLENGVCVSQCATGKINGNNCVSTCPTDNPYLENGVCVPTCQSGIRDGDNNCVTSCPEAYPYLENGICVAICSSGKRDGNNCVTSCPSDKVNDDGICKSTCPINKFNDNGDCVTSCPLSRPNINRVCKPCSEQSNKFNDNGVCVDSCPLNRPIDDNGFCKSLITPNQSSPSMSTSANINNTWLKAIDKNYNTFWEPGLGRTVTNFWYIFKWTINKPFIKGIKIKFQGVNTPLNLNIYRDVDDTIKTGTDLISGRNLSNNLVKSIEINNKDQTILQEELNITNVKNILVLFTNRTNIYEIQFY